MASSLLRSCWAPALLASALSCSEADSAPARSCVPGETRLCTGPGGCEGAQACLPDGQGLGACDCGSNPVPSSSDAGSECVSAEPGCALPNRLGAPCELDADCGSGFMCWSEAPREELGFSGGPARGYCTLGCTLAEDCQHVDPGAACSVPAGLDRGVCLRGCFSKDPEPGELKCLERDDVACWSTAVLGSEPFSILSRQQGFCSPSCGSDASCPGRFCDLATGLCADEPRQGAAIGSGCRVDDDCASGLCLSPIGGASYCSATCVFGTRGCGFAEASAARSAVCAAPLLSEGGVSEGQGDVGSCLEACEPGSACTSPEWQCAAAAGGFGVPGVCQFVGSEQAAGAAGDAL